MTEDIPDTGAVFTFGKSHFADNEPSHFFIKNDPVVAISCGDEHSAVICQNGRVFVFGANAWGQLGLGHKDEVTRPSCVKWLKPHRAMFVACGRAHTVFVTDTSAVYSVGCNDEGQLGTGDMEHQSVPQFVELDVDQNIKQVSAGSNHTALLTEDGRVFVCGSNSEGQLGLGEAARSCVTFTELKFVEKIAFVECGYYHTVFITAGGAVFVTGDNEHQKLGIPDMTTIYAPLVLPLDVQIKSACCGANHTFLLSMDEAKILAFGSNEKGQLGLPKDIDYVRVPTEVDMEKLFDGYQLKLVACGAMHTAFVTDNGLLYTCGESRHDKLCLEAIEIDNSNEDTHNQYLPKRVTAMNGFVVDNVACGGCHTLLTATKGSNADFSNNDFSIINEDRQISLTELPPLQKVPAMAKADNVLEDITNSNINRHSSTDLMNGNVEEIASLTSLEANVSGSHIVNINDLEIDNVSKGSMNEIPNIVKDEMDTLEKDVDKVMGSAATGVGKVVESVGKNVGNVMESVENNANKVKENVETMLAKGKDELENVAQQGKNEIENFTKGVTETIHTKSEAVEDIFKKTIVDRAPGLHSDERKVLEVPDKLSEIANSPPPKTPIIQDLLNIPDISQMSPNLSRKSDDGQKSETGQSENETIPCGSDKSSPPDKIAKTQAVIPIVRSEDHIDADDMRNCEDTDVVVNKLEEKGRFARMFQSIKDKENSCMGKGKVIEEKVVENVHKGIETAEESVHKVEQRVETEIRNQTSSRTCTIL
ncbi:probable E3 ubiquitin-protein ligase HERC3 [Bicyclus anynana]|uniref:Probable E3 ubiquitin-protein ligase HERC3 n=1 Tax=Bicyclus anynana TaxID=110368 RepID=A0A6J1NB64_BICAN|nr:probable E3 ubiquitin-protein ligase HERC3 [Bicyclus anynana]